jgi:acetyltransferase-like isoleucine patch superfamily enzyme
MPGVRIMQQCVIAANSLVNRSVKSKTVVAGTPARPIGRVEGEGVETKIVIDKATMIEVPCDYEMEID